MGRGLRRVRGGLLRLVRRRTTASTIGVFLLVMAFGVRLQGLSGDPGIDQGIGIVLGATGLAFLLAGWAARRPDWIDPE